MPAATLGAIRARAATTTPHRISVSSTARFSDSIVSPGHPHPAIRSPRWVLSRVGAAATAPRRRVHAVRSCTRGACATRSASPSTPTVRPRGSLSTTSARARGRRSTTAWRARTTDGMPEKVNARGARTPRARVRPPESPIRSRTTRGRPGRSSRRVPSCRTVAGRPNLTAATSSPTVDPDACGCDRRPVPSTTAVRF